MAEGLGSAMTAGKHQRGSFILIAKHYIVEFAARFAAGEYV